MAEAVFTHTASTQRGTSPRTLIGTVDSAGTGAYHEGSAPDSRTLAVLRAHGVRGYAHTARKVRPDDWARFDWILAMDADNLADLKAVWRRAVKRDAALAETARARVVLFGDFGGQAGEEVLDPYYGGVEGFERAFEQCGRFARGFLKAIEAEVESGADES